MKKKKLLSAVIAAAMLGTMPALHLAANAEEMSASADAEILTYGDLFYYVAEDGSITVTDCSDTVTDLVVPETIDGKTVSTIASYAFADKNNLLSVSLPTELDTMEGNIFSGCTNLVSIDMPERVRVMHSYEGQFDYCTSLESIAIPEGVTELFFGFGNCTALKSIYFPKSLTNLMVQHYTEPSPSSYLLVDCTALEEITVHPDNAYITVQDGALFNKNMNETMCLITHFDKEATSYTVPDGVTVINHAAFREHEKLESITMNVDSLQTIGSNVFDGCASLKSLHFPKNLSSIGRYSFQNTPSLAEFTVDEANPHYYGKDGVLYACGEDDYVTGNPYNNLIAYPAAKADKSFTVPSDITSIANSAFHSSRNLEEVIIGENITNIPDYCFSAGASLKTVSLPSALTSIGISAFHSCKSLTSIAIPASVTSIGDYAFEVTPSLTAIDVASENTAYKSEGGVLFNADMTDLIVYPAAREGDTYTVPETVSYVCSSAFHSGNKIKEVIFPEGLYSLNMYTFSKCTSLERVTLPSTLSFIGFGAFYHCDSLTSVTIPESVTNIDEYALSTCAALRRVEMPAGDITIGTTAFIDSTNITMYGTYDTAAHKFAQEQGIPFVDPSKLTVSLGNLNGDTAIDATDAAALLTAAVAAGTGADSGLTAEQITAADLNKDGAFDAKDASLILMYAAYTGTGGTMGIEEYLKQE